MVEKQVFQQLPKWIIIL